MCSLHKIKMNYRSIESLRLWVYICKEVPNSANKYQIVNTHEISKSPGVVSMKPMSIASNHHKHLACLNLHKR